MAKTYIKELQEKIEALEDAFDGHELEVQIIQNEMVDTLEPSVLLTNITYIHSEMLIELFAHIKKNSLTPRLEASKKRLVKLLEMSERLSSLSTKMESLKLINRQLEGKMQILRLENAELRKELDKITKSDQF